MSPDTAEKPATKTRRSRPAPVEPLPEPVTERFVVVSKKGRVFLICSGCQHWIRRRFILKCACCMSHKENPNAVKLAAELEN